MTKDDDIARWVARQAMAKGLTRDQAIELALEIRAEFGGCRLYVPKASPMGKAYVLGAALAAGTSLPSAIEAIGVSRRTAYRLMRRSWVIDWA